MHEILLDGFDDLLNELLTTEISSILFCEFTGKLFCEKFHPKSITRRLPINLNPISKFSQN